MERSTQHAGVCLCWPPGCHSDSRFSHSYTFWFLQSSERVQPVERLCCDAGKYTSMHTAARTQTPKCVSSALSNGSSASSRRASGRGPHQHQRRQEPGALPAFSSWANTAAAAAACHSRYGILSQKWVSSCGAPLSMHTPGRLASSHHYAA